MVKTDHIPQIPKIKICCIGSVHEAQMAIKAGASALGLVGKMPSGPGIIGDELIREIARQVPPPVDTFLLTSETTAERIIQHHRKTGTTAIQIVDKIDEDTFLAIRKELHEIQLVKVIHIIDDKSVAEAVRMSELADALLLDSGNPYLQVKKLGGTGRIHNWELSRKIVERTNIPVFLAGGLTPGNVKEALNLVQPFGLDVCNGVRTNGILDERKLENFFNNAGV